MREFSHTCQTADFFIFFHSAPDERATDWQPHRRFSSRHPADQGADPALNVLEAADGDYTRLIYREGMEFTINRTATVVWVRRTAPIALEYVTMLLMNAVLALCLRLREQVCLHASAVAAGERALIFVGASGAGKSTIASYFAQQQHPVFCDDVCVLSEAAPEITVQPGCPQLRLLPHSTEALLGDSGALKPIVEGWSKQVLDLDEQGYRLADRALPVGAIYLLLPRAETLSIQPLTPARALLWLMNNTYLDYLADQSMRTVDMRVLARLVSHVPVRLVTPHRDLAYLPDLYTRILQDFHAAASA